MAVIRPHTLSAAPVLISLKDAEDESARIIAAGRAEVERARDAAREEGLDAGRREGFAKGLEEGHAAAFTEHQEELRQAASALARAGANVDSMRDELRANLTSELVELAVALAERVTKRQAEFDPQVAVTNLEHAVRLVTGARQLRVAINPLDYAVVQQSLDQMRISHPILGGAELVADESIARGGCRVFTEHGLIDADVNVQLDRLTEQMFP